MWTRWTPRLQGDAGERSGIVWLLSKGAAVFMPIGHSPDFNLVADWGGRLDRVQVKTSTFWTNGRWEVMLATRGGNRSWNGVIKRVDATRRDSVFVHVGDGRRWFIPATALGGNSHIVLAVQSTQSLRSNRAIRY